MKLKRVSFCKGNKCKMSSYIIKKMLCFFFKIMLLIIGINVQLILLKKYDFIN